MKDVIFLSEKVKTVKKTSITATEKTEEEIESNNGKTRSTIEMQIYGKSETEDILEDGERTSEDSPNDEFELYNEDEESTGRYNLRDRDKLKRPSIYEYCA